MKDTEAEKDEDIDTKIHVCRKHSFCIFFYSFKIYLYIIYIYIISNKVKKYVFLLLWEGQINPDYCSCNQ